MAGRCRGRCGKAGRDKGGGVGRDRPQRAPSGTGAWLTAKPASRYPGGGVTALRSDSVGGRKRGGGDSCGAKLCPSALAGWGRPSLQGRSSCGIRLAFRGNVDTGRSAAFEKSGGGEGKSN